MSTLINLIKTRADSGQSLWLYALYMVIACSITAGLNIVHTKYFLQIDMHPKLFIVPSIAGILFGFVTAKIKIRTDAIKSRCDLYVISKHVLQACFITSALNVVHTEWILNQPLTTELFIAPLIAGVFFGFLIAKIQILNNKLLRLASTDLLTRTANRMQFDKCLNKELEKAKNTGETFSIIYFDIDNFKDINDQYGHLTGDHILVEVAHCVKKTIRHGDVLARYGGDEFIILARASDLKTSLQLAEELKKCILATTLEMKFPVSCSFGVIEYTQQRDSIASLIKAVDNAMYAAKNDGRNCVTAG